MQAEHPQAGQGGEGVVGNEGEEVVVKVEHLHLNHVHKLLSGELGHQVVLQEQSLERTQSRQAAVGQSTDPASVQVNRCHSRPAQEHLRPQLAKVVAVEVEDGGVHGDLPGHVGEVPGGALDHVEGPGLVVVAGAGVGAFHPTVASQEGATPGGQIDHNWKEGLSAAFPFISCGTLVRSGTSLHWAE